MPRRISAQQLRLAFVSSFTGANLLLGVVSMLLAAAGDIQGAALCLLGCVVCDSLDGAFARKLDASSPFGAQFDSLADMTSFSLGSAVLAYYWFQGNTHWLLLLGAALMYVLAGAIRLARFNVTPYSSRFFQGMPTTAVAAVVAVVYLTVPGLDHGLGLGMMVALALLMVSVFPYLKFTELRKAPRWSWPLMVLCAVLNYFLVSVPLMLWGLIAAYVLSGPAIWWRNKRRLQGSGVL